MKIIYKSNAGVIVESAESKIMIDVLCDAGDLLYTSLSRIIADKIISGACPYDGINYMLCTHGHMDHFNENDIERYLYAGGKAEILIPPNALRKVDVKCRREFSDQIHELKTGIFKTVVVKDENIRITAFSFKHEGKESADEENIGYLIEIEGKKIFHVGDAKIDNENFSDFKEKDIDVLIAPFPFITRSDGVKIIKKFINPSKLAIVHLPCKEKDVCGWIGAAYQSRDRLLKDFDGIEIFTEPDQCMDVSPAR